jgi:membrane protease YdiL (CAAX protease family)
MLVRFAPDRRLAIAALVFVVAVAANAAAWSVEHSLARVALYHGLFALGVCIVMPTWYHVHRLGLPLAEMGLTLRRWPRDLAVGAGLATLTVAPRIGEVAVPATAALACLVAAMAFSTLYEEVLFRGFLQTTVERALGMLPALLLSGLAFSLYHVGMDAHYRRFDVLAGMTLVGTLFAFGFRLTGSVLTSYTLNLPHAVVTFIIPGRDLAFAEATGLFAPSTAALALATAGAGLAWLAYLASGAAATAHPAAPPEVDAREIA